MAKFKRYTPVEIAWLRRAYQSMTITQLLPLFNKKFNDNRGYDGIKSCLEHRSIFAERPQIHGPNSGQFGPGNMPHNTKYDGHERICAKDGYILVRTNQRNPYTGALSWYRPKQHIVWEEAHGKVPAGHVLTFKDDDKLNCDLANLEIITKPEHCRRNKMQYLQAQPAIRQSVKMLAKLITATSEASRR